MCAALITFSIRIFHIHIFQPVNIISLSINLFTSYKCFMLIWVRLFAVDLKKTNIKFRALKTWICFYKVMSFFLKRISKKKHGDSSSSPPYYHITTMKNQKIDDFLLSSDSVPSGGAAPFRFTRIGVKSQRFKRTKASVCASNPVARASKIS